MKNYTQIGGARIGWFNATWPFAKIEVLENQIKLSILGKYYEFQKEESLQLKKYHGLFSKGLKIECAITNYPDFLVFWSFNLKALIGNLEKCIIKSHNKAIQLTLPALRLVRAADFCVISKINN